MMEPNSDKPKESQVLQQIHQLLDALEPLAEHLLLVRTALKENRGDERPAWVHPDRNSQGSTYLEIARQFVEAHRQCPYWALWEEPLASTTVRWRANFRLMFMEGRKAAKLDEAKGWKRMLEIMPTPHDAALNRRAQELMTQVVAKKMAPGNAAIELTTDFLRIRRNETLKRDFVRQGADDKVSRAAKINGAAKPDPHFKQGIEMIKDMLAREGGRKPPEQKPDRKTLARAIGPRPPSGYC